jgi:hypothetical protein
MMRASLALAGLLLLLLGAARAGAQEDPASADAVLDDASMLVASIAAEQEESYPRLRLYGFADFTFSKFFIDDTDLFAYYLPSDSTFSVGNINLYVDSQISTRLRSLIEVRFSFLPNGAPSIDSSNGQILRQSTQANDYRIVGRASQWGSIGIERVVVSYDVLPWLTVSAGRYITPWGLWNIDHGTPTLINAISPLAIDSQFIPARQTGLMISGAWAWPALSLGYFLTLSNGRGPVDTYRDFDENKAVGGRVYVSTMSLVGQLTLGGTFYFGSDTDPREQFVRLPGDGSQAYIETTHRVTSDERALAADLKWEWGGLLLASEIVVNGRAYKEGGRAAIDQGQTALTSDGRLQISPDSVRYGGYVLVGYRFPWLGVMPFVNIEYSRSSEQPIGSKLLSSQVGLNIRPEPGLVVKLVGALVYFADSDPRFFGDDPTVYTYAAQVAWAF